MASLNFLLLTFICFSSLLSPLHAQTTCTSYTFPNNKHFAACTDLPALNTFIHWNYNPDTGIVDLAFRKPNMTADSSRWISWAINPTSTGMIGAQSLVAFKGSDGVMLAYTSPITAYGTGLEKGDLSFRVPEISAVFENDNMIIFAKIELPNNKTTVVNHLWQEGPMSGDTPGMHDLSGPNVESMGVIDFVSGKIATTTTTGSTGLAAKQRKKIWHGVLCTVGFGILMPLGTMTARYLKTFQEASSAWFYIHVFVQLVAVAVGIAGGGIGLKLGTESLGILYNSHGQIGVAIFCFTVVQVLMAVVLRPKPDHKCRKYWTWGHRIMGCIVIAMSIVNILKGFDILRPDKMWKQAYIGTVVALGACAVVLEAIKWVIAARKKGDATQTSDGSP